MRSKSQDSIGGAANADVQKPLPPQLIIGIDILEIDDDRASHSLLHLLEIKRAELLPFSHDDQPICSLGARIRSITKRHLGEDRSRLLHSRGIEGAHARSHVLQRGHQGD